MKIVFKELKPDSDGFPEVIKEIDTTEFFGIELHTSSGIFSLSDNEDGSLTLRTHEGIMIMIVNSENKESITLTNKPYKDQ